MSNYFQVQVRVEDSDYNVGGILLCQCPEQDGATVPAELLPYLRRRLHTHPTDDTGRQRRVFGHEGNLWDVKKPADITGKMLMLAGSAATATSAAFCHDVPDTIRTRSGVFSRKENRFRPRSYFG